MFKSVYILSGLYVAILMYWAAQLSQAQTDAQNAGISWGFFLAGASACAVFCLPALALSLARTWPRMAITLAACPAVLAFGLAALGP